MQEDRTRGNYNMKEVWYHHERVCSGRCCRNLVDISQIGHLDCRRPLLRHSSKLAVLMLKETAMHRRHWTGGAGALLPARMPDISQLP